MNLNPTYSSNPYSRQQKSISLPQKLLQGKVSLQKFNDSKLYYKVKLGLEMLSGLKPEHSEDLFAVSHIPEGVYKILRRVYTYLKNNHNTLVGNVMNVSQSALAESWNVSTVTVRRQMNLLKKLGVFVDTNGEKFKSNHPLWKHFDTSNGPKKQYFICFDGFFEKLCHYLFSKRYAYLACQKAANKKDQLAKTERNESVETVIVDKPEGKLEDNSRKTTSLPIKNDRYNKNLSIFNRISKNLNHFFQKSASKVSIPSRSSDGIHDYRLSRGSDDGAFSDLFSPTILQTFNCMTESDKEIFLNFKKQQIIHYMRQYSAYSSRQERANKGLAVLEALWQQRQRV